MRLGFFALWIINVPLRMREQKSIRLLTNAREMNNCFIARFILHGLISSMFGNYDVINV